MNTRRIATAAGAAALLAAGLTGCMGTDKIPDPAPDLGNEGTVTVTSPIRLDANSQAVSDSIVVTLSASLVDAGWTPALSDGSCNALSPGANTHWIGADGVSVTSFQQTTATHVILRKSEDAADLDCDLEYSIPESVGTTVDAKVPVEG